MYFSKTVFITGKKYMKNFINFFWIIFVKFYRLRRLKEGVLI